MCGRVVVGSRCDWLHSPLGYELLGCFSVCICMIVPNGMMCCFVRSSFLFSTCIFGVVLECFEGRLLMCCIAALYTSPASFWGSIYGIGAVVVRAASFIVRI
jgi:hypothetical protein